MTKTLGDPLRESLKPNAMELSARIFVAGLDICPRCKGDGALDRSGLRLDEMSCGRIDCPRCEGRRVVVKDE